MEVSYGRGRNFLLTNRGRLMHWVPDVPQPIAGLSNLMTFTVHRGNSLANTSFAVDQNGALLRWVNTDEADFLRQVRDQEGEPSELPPLVDARFNIPGSELAILDEEGRVGIIRRPADAPQLEWLPVAPAKQIAWSEETLCSLSFEGAVSCRGRDSRFGCLGRGHLTDDDPNFAPVEGLSDIVEVTGSRTVSACALCARNRADEVWCWGANYQDVYEDDVVDQGDFLQAIPLASPSPRRIQGLP